MTASLIPVLFPSKWSRWSRESRWSRWQGGSGGPCGPGGQGGDAKCRYLFDPKDYVFISRFQMFSQTLKPTFRQFHQSKCWIIFEMSYGNVHWELETNVAKDTGIAGFYLTQMKQTSVSLSCQNNKGSLKSFVR